MDYRILRGADKIGGNIIEISSQNTKMLVEFGRELDNESGELTGMEQDILKRHYDACLITHYHGDHAANIGKLTCPVWMGQRCKKVMQVQADHKQCVLPPHIETYQDGKPFDIGGIMVTPFLCDHSALDSYMLLFECGGKKILYTGDWRTNGRKSENAGFDRLLKKLPKVDVLITENTNAHRTDVQQLTEAELVDKATEIMANCVTADNKPAPVFVLCATTNFDRIVFFIKAANKRKRKFWMDKYQAELCKAASDKIPVNTEIRGGGTLPTLFFVRQSKSTRNLIKKIAQKHGGMMIYSMWEGYKKKDDMRNFLDDVKSWGVKVVSLHTSGHADTVQVDRLIKHVSKSDGTTDVQMVHCEHKPSDSEQNGCGLSWQQL